MKNFITIIAFLLVTIPVSAQNYFSVTYMNVSPENVSEVARLESTYWSKVAKANIDSGNLLAWGLFARPIPAGNDTWTHAFINVFDSIEKMTDNSIWNPESILGISAEDIATGGLVKNYVVHHYKIQGSINQGTPAFTVWNFARPENLQGFVGDNIRLWKPFFENDMGGRVSWGIGTKITNVTSTNATVMTWDGYESMSDAVSALDYPINTSFQGPRGDKTADYNPNGWLAQVIVQRVIWLSATE
jgi:hypothetical protein|tara:strand:- start:234 stop:968 length:735 start_codon:yes stop_codon:yes gene_type:complete